jgi:hypothetical protein
MIQPNQIVEFDPKERESFRIGDLREEWTRTYPQLFDKDDVRIARTQPNYHFYEWFAAVYIYKQTGELSLVEQYQFPSHRRKRFVVAQLMSPTLVRFIETASTQAPDLLVYADDFSGWYFCEIKSPRDKISPAQQEYFTELEHVSGKPVYVLRLRERK